MCLTIYQSTYFHYILRKSMNIRDVASINELAILSNLETINAQMIKEQIDKTQRFDKLKEIAKYQLAVLNDKDFMKSLKKLNDKTYIEEQNKKR